MKFFLSSVIGLLVIASAMAIDKEEAKGMFKEMSKECKESEKATDDDVEKMMNETYPESREGKCFVACVQEQFGLVQDKKFVPEVFNGFGAIVAGDDVDKQRKIQEIAEECKDVTHEDRCELAIMIGKCMEKGAKDRELKLQ